MPLDVALIPPVNMSNTAEKHLQEILTNHETAQNIAQDNIREAQRKYTQQYDKCTKDPNYKPGDRVWLLSTRVKKVSSLNYVANMLDHITFASAPLTMCTSCANALTIHWSSQ